MHRPSIKKPNVPDTDWTLTPNMNSTDVSAKLNLRPSASLTRGDTAAPIRAKKFNEPTNSDTSVSEREKACSKRGVTSAVMPRSYPRLQLFRAAQRTVSLRVRGRTGSERGDREDIRGR